MPTARKILYDAFRVIGQMRPGYENGPELLQDGLDTWRDFFDTLNASRTGSYSTPDYIYPITGSNSLTNGIYGPNIQFTIGPPFTFSAVLVSGQATAATTATDGLIIGQSVTGTGIPANTYIAAFVPQTSVTFSNVATANGAQTITVVPCLNGPRPTEIIQMNMYMTSVAPNGPARLKLDRLYTAEEFSGLTVLAMSATNVATCYWYNPTYPQGTLNIFPPINGNSLEIFTWGFLNTPLTLDSTFSAPPGYAEAIKYCLAARLWPLCTNQIMVNKIDHRQVKGWARQRLDAVRLNNAPRNRMVNDFQGSSAPGASGAVSDWSLLLVGIPY